MAVEWSKLRPWDGSQNTAFEMLVCQLAEYERVPDGSMFVRKGAPDAGVECYWQLPDGRELGWQAKYFTSSPTRQQWTQVDSSVKKALDKHPDLQNYTICMAVDLPDARIEGESSSFDRWTDRVEKWKGWVAERNMCVDFSFWGTHEVVERLSRAEHLGRHFFWFNEEILSPTWFQRQLDDAVAAIGPRYTPELNVQLPISKVFDSLSRSPAFLARFQEVYGDIGKARPKGSLKIVEEFASDDSTNLRVRLHDLIKTAKRFDKEGVEPIDWSVMAGQAREALESIYRIERLIENREPNQSEDAGREEQSSRGSSTRDRLAHTQYNLRRIREKLWTLEEFINSDSAKQANRPALLLVGDAGTGKTHLFGDAARNHVESGAPAILLLGNRFRDEEPWGQILRMLGLSCEQDQFLGALQTAAQLSGRRAVIFIDALNEGEGRRMWEKWLPSMLECLKRYPWIAIAVSVRSSYEEWIIPAGLAPDKLIKHVHRGFSGHEYDAAKTFFEHYGIQLPATPMLTPEFQNPLFLRCFCQGLHNKGLTKIPTGIKGITSVFDFFLDSVNEKLSKPELLNYDRRSRLVSKATSKLAEWISQANEAMIPREEAGAICDSLLPTQGYEQSIFRHLLSEGVLTETGYYGDDTEFQEMVMFSYERLADHLVMRKLIDEHVDLHKPEAAFVKDQPLGGHFEDEYACWRNRGLLDALAIQGPAVLKREVFELVPSVKDSRPVCEAFIESLLWRDPDTFSEGCLPYINAHIASEHSLNNEFMNTILMIASIPNHPFNADFLHSTLVEQEMAERDAWWSIFLHDNYGEKGSVERLIDWAWSDTSKPHISNESIRLVGTALIWLLTTSHRFLRDRATKALVSLFVERIDVLCKLIPTFGGVNDLYVLERLYAVAYGCALRSNDANAKASLAQQVYDSVFRDGTPPCHILLRDYARGVVEVAINEGAELDIDPRKIRPPYKSEWPLEIPPEGELEKYGEWSEDMPEEEWALESIYDSVMGRGDFASYIIGTDRKSLQWSNLRLDEERLPTPQEQFEAFEESLTEQQRKAWSYYLESRYCAEQLYKRLDTLAGAFREASQRFASVISAELGKEERRFRRTLGMKKKNLLSEVVLPYLDGPPVEEDEFDLPPSIAQRWIFKRVLDLGWTVERFGRFDRYISRYGNNYRSANKPERIGKKYQWIAYHEFLAHLADNLKFREDSWSEKPDVYDGSWQLGIRDIDPSSFLRNTWRSHEWEPSVSVWWASVHFDAWTEEPDEIQWLKCTDLLPKMGALPIAIDPETGREWVVLESFYRWEELTPPEVDRFNIKRRSIWYMLKSYLVKADDEESFCGWSKQQHFMGRWMPETQPQTQVFLGEFFRMPSFKYFDTPYDGRAGWTKRSSGQNPLPCEVLVTSDSYLQEGGLYDCSIEDTVAIYLPAMEIVDTMGLSWRGDDGRFFDRAGRMAAQDPSARTPGPQALLMDKELMTNFLNSRGYRLVWTLLGEKDVLIPGGKDDNWPGRMELSGYMRMKDGQVLGEATAYWNTAGAELERIRTIPIP
ncbi:MAG: hypothetical protein OXO50_15385 [Caldilineaceae bacterium]|nr:hypothetical protein [Caldilineaceae bacterium]